MNAPASAAAQIVVQQLRTHNLRLVLAESCTAGLAAATLAHIPGISAWFCGSAVVYRLETKHHWLGVPRELFAPPGPGVVSQEVAEAMASGVLDHTPEAQVAAAITGHLGPDAPVDQDGLIWMSVALRTETMPVRLSKCCRLGTDVEPPQTLRETRQHRAAQCLLVLICEALVESPP